MKDTLKDLISHTHDLGCIDLIKIEGTDEETILSGVAGDRSVVIQGKFLKPNTDFKGTFGMPNMSTLKTILNIDEYNTDAKLSVSNSGDGPESIHFENATGDFQNDYRFMVQNVVDTMLKTVKFKGAKWNVDIEPTIGAIHRLKNQKSANPDHNTFNVTIKDNDLVFTFGDATSHSGNFVFATDIEGTLTRAWDYPAEQVINILSLDGDKVMRFSNDGVLEIIVMSGLAEYTYILPAHTK